MLRLVLLCFLCLRLLEEVVLVGRAYRHRTFAQASSPAPSMTSSSVRHLSANCLFAKSGIPRRTTQESQDQSFIPHHMKCVCQKLEQLIQHENYGNYSLRRTCSASDRTMHTPSKESRSTCEPMHRPMTCLPRLHRVRIYRRTVRRTVRRTGPSKSKPATNLCFAFKISNSFRPEKVGAAEGRAGTEVMESKCREQVRTQTQTDRTQTEITMKDL